MKARIVWIMAISILFSGSALADDFFRYSVEISNQPFARVRIDATREFDQLSVVPGPAEQAGLQEVDENPVSDDDWEEADQAESSTQVETEILRLVNLHRKEAGLSPLIYNRKLAAAARQHSKEMFDLGYFSHTSPVDDYATLSKRLHNAGAPYRTAGENIAMSTAATARGFVDMWMNSPGHRANILRPGNEFTGIGVSGEGGMLYATQVFSS